MRRIVLTLGCSAFSRVSVSAATAVVEPATWAMMIAGFGIASTAAEGRYRLKSGPPRSHS